MEADSTSQNILRSWGSSDTLDSPDDIFFVCQICKVREDISVREAKQRAEDRGTLLFFAKSQMFLRCTECSGIFHLHCHLKVEVMVELLLDTIEPDNIFICAACKSQENEYNGYQ